MLSEKEEKVMSLVRTRGPILPIDAKKATDLETYIISAILSTLVRNGQLKLTSRKIGASPLYYLSGQEDRVREILSKELNEIEKRALERVRELKVALDTDLYPQERFLMDSLKDYISKFILKHNGRDITLWKHSSVSDQEMNTIVEQKLGKEQEQIAKDVLQKFSDQAMQVPAIAPVVQTEIQQQDSFKQIAGINSENTEIIGAIKTPHEQSLKSDRRDSIKKERAVKSDDFENKISAYLNSINAITNSTKRIKKGELVIDVSANTPFGIHNFLIKAKNKGTISENDLAMFMMECQTAKKLGILIVPKAISKKTADYIKKNIGDLIKIVIV